MMTGYLWPLIMAGSLLVALVAFVVSAYSMLFSYNPTRIAAGAALAAISLELVLFSIPLMSIR